MTLSLGSDVGPFLVSGVRVFAAKVIAIIEDMRDENMEKICDGLSQCCLGVLVGPGLLAE